MVTAYDVNWTDEARRVLRKQFRFIAIKKQQPWNAIKFRTAFMEFVYDKVANSPRSFSVNRRLSTQIEEFRSVNFKRNYKIIFRIEEEIKSIVITNIFHNKRHPSKLKAK